LRGDTLQCQLDVPIASFQRRLLLNSSRGLFAAVVPFTVASLGMLRSLRNRGLKHARITGAVATNLMLRRQALSPPRQVRRLI